MAEVIETEPTKENYRRFMVKGDFDWSAREIWDRLVDIGIPPEHSLHPATGKPATALQIDPYSPGTRMVTIIYRVRENTRGEEVAANLFALRDGGKFFVIEDRSIGGSDGPYVGMALATGSTNTESLAMIRSIIAEKIDAEIGRERERVAAHYINLIDSLIRLNAIKPSGN